MLPSLEERARLVMGLARGAQRASEIMARYAVPRETVEVWVQEFVYAVPDRFDSEMLSMLRMQGLAIPEVHTHQSGRISDIPPLDLLQSLSIYRSAGHVVFFHPHGTSQLWFEAGGEIIDARSGALQGEAAVYRIVTHDAGDYRVDVTGASRPRTIDMSATALIFDGARRVDEAKRVAETLPPSGSVLACDPGAVERAGLGDGAVRVAGLFAGTDGGATVGEVLEASPLGDLETWTILGRLQETGLLVPTGATRRPEIPSAERRASALQKASVDVSAQMSQRSSRASLEISQPSLTAMRVTTGPSARTPPPPNTRARLAIGGAAAGVLLLVIGLVVALGGDDAEAPAASIAAVDEAGAGAAPAPVPERCPPGTVELPEVEITMGREAGIPMAAPAHLVIVPALCVDRFEVTVAEYGACVEQGRCASTIPPVPVVDELEGKSRAAKLPTRDERCNEGHLDREEHPINCVTWDDANTFCRVMGKRLPTEAQWERIARGPRHDRHPWGHDPPTSERLNACGRECSKGVPAYADLDPYPATAPVGRLPAGATPEGIHHLAGNVREWTADGRYDYASAPAEDPYAPPTDDSRMVRGGSFASSDRVELDVSYRRVMQSHVRKPDVGFRCVTTPQE